MKPDLPERLQGVRGLKSLLKECLNNLNPSQNVSLMQDIRDVLKDTALEKEFQGMESSLKVIYTWAGVDGALRPIDVIKLIKRNTSIGINK